MIIWTLVIKNIGIILQNWVTLSGGHFFGLMKLVCIQKKDNSI